MNIVITDGFALNPGDLNWDPLREWGSISLFERTSPDEIFARCSDADIIITNKTPITGALIRSCAHLKLISVTATGYNIVDTETAKEKKIAVCNVPGYGTASVAQHTIALLLELTNRAGMHEESVRRGDWFVSADWCYSLGPIIELESKVFGIVGMGHIGTRVMEIVQAMGMKVVYYSRTRKENLEATFKSLQEIFRESDFISLHCPLTPHNGEFVNHELLSLMKPGSYLINTSRGQLINEADLAAALRDKKIAGAALDVLSKEPPPPDHPLIGLPNCLVTPHNAWISREARQRVMDITVGNIRGFAGGQMQNQVNAWK